MTQTTTAKPKSQMLSLHPSATFEIDFDGLLKPMTNDEYKGGLAAQHNWT